MDKTLNILMVVTILSILVLTYHVFFLLPTDPLALAKLQVNLGSAYLILFVLLFIRHYRN